MKYTESLGWPNGAVVARHAALMPALLLLFGGCTATAPLATVTIAAPAKWYAPLPQAPGISAEAAAGESLPHNGSLTKLSQWWRQQNDELLVELIEAAQAVNPNVITARSNILQARATRASSEAALLPRLDGVASISRGLSAPINRTLVPPPTTLAQLGLQTNWELDLFGGNQASLSADEQRLEGAEALWHDARVSVAAEVANQYYSLRSCEKLLQVAGSDALSRAETARLNGLAAQAGFTAPATAALARASAAESSSRLTQQRAQCELDVKALVSLTGLAEPVLRARLAAQPAATVQQAMAAISSVPAEVLAQRPDVYSASRSLAAASFEVGSARAQRYPRLSIAGSIFTNRSRTRVFNQNFDTWSVGPLALTVPLFDGGASQANLEAARARYEEAAGKYRGAVRQAVREVEEALVNLQSATDRAGDTGVAAEGYRTSFTGTEARYKAGLASLVELEESRRSLLASQSAVLNLERESRGAWIALYRALGGGWSTASPHAEPMTFDIPVSALPSWPPRASAAALPQSSDRSNP